MRGNYVDLLYRPILQRGPLRCWFGERYSSSANTTIRQFAVYSIILAVIAGCFPLLFRRARRKKIRVSAAKARLVVVLSLHLSAISASARNHPARQLPARRP